MLFKIKSRKREFGLSHHLFITKIMAGHVFHDTSEDCNENTLFHSQSFTGRDNSFGEHICLREMEDNVLESGVILKSFWSWA